MASGSHAVVEHELDTLLHSAGAGIPASQPLGACCLVRAGEYVAVEKVEGVLKGCALAEQVWVYGNSFESCLVAVVVPQHKALMAWADKAGLQGTFEVRVWLPMLLSELGWVWTWDVAGLIGPPIVQHPSSTFGLKNLLCWVLFLGLC